MPGEELPRNPLRALVLEDDPADFEILQRHLGRGGLRVECLRIETEREFAARLSPECDFILSDFALPGWDAFRALEVLRTSGLEIPLLVVSGTISEDLAVECMKRGAADYLLKDRLARLPQAVLRATGEVVERRKAAEARRTALELERLEAILDGLTEAILIADPEGRLQHLNPAAVRLYGFDTMARALERLGGRLDPLESRDAGGRLFAPEELPLARSLRDEIVSDMEMHVHNPITGKRWIGSYSSTPVRDSAGALIHVVATVRDITERRHLERELRAAEDRLRDAQKMESIGVLAGGIAHDFNNLLTGVIGNASLALESMPARDENRPFLEAVMTSANRAADLTRQMLAYAGKGRFLVGRVNLSETVREMVGLMRGAVPATIGIALHLEEQIVAVEADAGQIHQIVMNLVLNASEAIGERPGQIMVQTQTRKVDAAMVAQSELNISAGTYVCLEVEDTGPGMDETTKARIFEPFFTTKFTGRGLGLAAVHGIVRAYKGAVLVTTHPGKGAHFTVLLPAAGAVAPQKAEIGAQAQELYGQGTVLVVDDEEAVLEVAKTSLERFGYRVLVARNGIEAVETFARTPDQIAVVVLDLTMPLMSGEETLQRLREIRADVPVLLSSGYDQIDVIKRFTGLGLAGFIGKPYSSAALVAKVKSVSAGTAG
jgi:two-component system, cell cycle sensor histidine kinase and response regulator CckA